MRLREFTLREDADPNKLVVTVNMAGQTKEYDMTGRFQGSTKQQMDQASQLITDFCERKQMPQCQITVRFQGYRMNTTTSSAYMGALPEPVNEIRKGQKDSNGYSSCWTGYHAAGTKKGKNGGRVRNCVKNESVNEGQACPQCGSTACTCAPGKCTCKPVKGFSPKKKVSEGWLDSAINAIPRPFDEKEVAKDLKGTANQARLWQGRGVIDLAKLSATINQLRAQGLEDRVIRQMLQRDGVPQRYIDQAFAGSRDGLNEMPARLRNDPDGPTIIPHGGMGSGKEETWRTIASGKLKQVAEMIESGNYQGAEHVLYKNGYLEGAVRALARYEEFRVKQGRRKLARGREVDLG